MAGFITSVLFDMTQAKSTDIYGNWAQLSPEGVLMCRTNEKRAMWYVSRGLAVLEGENSIRLTFKPNGMGHDGEPAYLEGKINRCVVCGTEHDLNRHHVVPYQYRKHFPIEHKARSSYDILPLCLDDHEKYEVVAQQFSIVLADHYGEANKRQAIKSAKTLLRYGPLIPEDRYSVLMQQIRDYLGIAIVTSKDLLTIVGGEYPTQRPSGNTHAEMLVSAVLERNELQNFIQQWRRHFIDTMQPKFLSPHWIVNFTPARHMDKS